MISNHTSLQSINKNSMTANNKKGYTFIISTSVKDKSLIIRKEHLYKLYTYLYFPKNNLDYASETLNVAIPII